MPALNRIANHAGNLVHELAMLRERTDTADRPIIFVAHSLGGLVCEDAVLVSQVSAEDHMRQISECTKGFAFLGTPHHGADLAKWGSAFVGFTSLLKRANSALVQTLKPDSEVLARIQQDFHSSVRTRAQDPAKTVQITCFWEELEVRGVGFIVPQHSAILPGYTPVGIHADHVGMTKFAKSSSPGFRSVSDQLWLWVNKIKKQRDIAASNTAVPVMRGEWSSPPPQEDNRWTSPSPPQEQRYILPANPERYNVHQSGSNVISGTINSGHVNFGHIGSFVNGDGTDNSQGRYNYQGRY